MRRTLTENQNYEIAAEFEVVTLIRKHGFFSSGRKEVVVGDFYGDPTGAAISHDEKFVVMVGCGFILYYLSEPFEPYSYNTSSTQWIERFREPNNIWWIDKVEWGCANTFYFTVEEHSEHSGAYRVVLPSVAIEKVTR